MELETFGRLVRGPELHIDLARVALAIARIEYPELSPDGHLAQLDRLAERSGARGMSDGRKALDRLCRSLFEEEGFRGNAARYYDPRNSCLNDVLERKLGIPITLSLLMIEVGRRAGLTLAGIGLPGHFVVGAQLGGGQVLLDPFNGGVVLSPAGAATVVARALGRPVELTQEHFASCGKRQILIRMLRNLRTIYAKQEDWAKALAVVDRLLVLDGEAPIHRRDRGTVLVKLGRLAEGAADWQRYLTTSPEALDAEGFRRELRRVRQDLASLN